jgi:hypothetical protein
MSFILEILPFLQRSKRKDHKNIKVFPKLAFRDLFITGIENPYVVILNKNGDFVLCSLVSSDHKVDIDKLPCGLYILQISDNNRTSYHQFQKVA